MTEKERWQRLDQDVRAHLEAQAATPPPPIWEVPLEQVRANDRQAYGAIPKVPVDATEDVTIPSGNGSIAARIYQPLREDVEAAGMNGSLGIVVLLHGGGFVLGDLETHDPAARRMAAGAGTIVVSVDYRLAPEHPFPAGVEDAVTATQWVMDHAADLRGDADRVIVSGDSAGGNLATVVARRWRDEDRPPLAGQSLIYPVTDMRPTSDWPSRRELASGFGLTRAVMNWFGEQYFTDEAHLAHPDASPIVVEDLKGLAPAFVLTAEFDPLRDEANAYAERMRDAGVDVEHHEIPSTIHGALTNPAGFASGDVMWRRLNDWTRLALTR